MLFNWKPTELGFSVGRKRYFFSKFLFFHTQNVRGRAKKEGKLFFRKEKEHYKSLPHTSVRRHRKELKELLDAPTSTQTTVLLDTLHTASSTARAAWPTSFPSHCNGFCSPLAAYCAAAGDERGFSLSPGLWGGGSAAAIRPLLYRLEVAFKVPRQDV
jgi:hypothetical protein